MLNIIGDRIVLRGDGFNFADGTPRDLTVIFTNSTLTFEKNHLISYLGFERIKHLKPGMKILIDSQENIRSNL